MLFKKKSDGQNPVTVICTLLGSVRN